VDIALRVKTSSLEKDEMGLIAMPIPLRLLTRFSKFVGLAQVLDDHVIERERLDAQVNSLEIKLKEYEQLLQLMTDEFQALRDGQQHDLLPFIMFSPDLQSGQMAKKVLSLLRPMDVVDGELIRRGRPNDGGYVVLKSGTEDATVYSLGIGDDVSWDLDMAAVGCTVYQYDHSIAAPPMTDQNFKWFKLKIGTTNDNETITVADAISRNGHRECNNMILKMDIETAEWDVLQSIDERTLSQFSQIIVELHCVYTNGRDWIAKIAAVLCKVNKTHQVIHLHANNYGYLGLVGGVVIPSAFEVTDVRRGDHEFRECKKVFPTALDRPCRADAPDYYLGPAGSVPEFDSA
jgi:hypothetical protein